MLHHPDCRYARCLAVDHPAGVLRGRESIELTWAFTPGADPQKCVVDLSRSAVADYTAVDALADVAARYEKVEKSFEIIGVSADDKKFIQLAGPAVKGAADALDGGVTRVSSKTALVEDIEANPKDVELRQRAGSHS